MNEKMVYQLIDTLIREYGDNYTIVDVSTLSRAEHKRPRLLWRSDEGVVVTLSFMPLSFFEILKEEQVLILSQVQVEFNIAQESDADASAQSTRWTREVLGLNK